MKKILTYIIGIAAFTIFCTNAFAAETGVADCDFDNLSELQSALWTLNVPDKEGASCSVETDPVSNSKALKITYPKFSAEGNDNGISAIYEIGNAAGTHRIDSGKVRVNYDIRFANHSVSFINLLYSGQFNAPGWNVATKSTGFRVCNTDYWVGIDRNSEKYYNVCNIIDFTNRTFEAVISLDGQTIISSSAKNITRDTFTQLDRLSFQLKNDTVTGNQSGIGVYYIDNISVEYEELKAESVIPANNSNDNGIESDIVFKFNYDISANAQDVEIYENGTFVPDENYIVSTEKENLKIHFLNGLKYGSAYKVIIKNSIASADSSVKMKNDYILEFLTKNLITTDIENYIGIENEKKYNIGKSFRIPQDSNISYNIFIDDGNGWQTYTGYTVNREGSYNLKISASENDSKNQIKEYKFIIVGNIEPVAKEVTVRINNGILYGEYIFGDANDDLEGQSEYCWYRAGNKEGAYIKIDGAGGKTYTLTESDYDCYILFEVLPVSENEPCRGIAVRSDAYAAPFKPIIKSAAIEGDIGVGNALKAKYEYYDENNDEEEGTVIQWHRCRIDSNISEEIAGAVTDTYVMTEDDRDCKIYFAVIPKNKAENGIGNEFQSEKINSFIAPVANNLKITGTAKSGHSLGADFDYYDINGDKPGNAIYKWYIGNTLISDKPTLEVSSDFEGKTVTLEVVPVAVCYPYEGKPVRTSISIIGSGSSGGSGASGVRSLSPVTNVTSTEEKQPHNINGSNNDENMFPDILGHWAESEIKKMYEKKIACGDENGLFNPENTVTRAEFASFISRAFNLSGDENTDIKDVKENDWYYEAVNAVASQGYMVGNDGCFRPSDNITRDEICVILCNILSKSNNISEATLSDLFDDDADFPVWAKQSIYYCKGIGIISGIDDSRFGTGEYATRAQAAVFIDRLMGILEEK